MVTLLGIILDAIVAVVFISTVFMYIKRGFVASLLNLMGTLASLLIGVIVSNILAPVIFDNFIKDSLTESVQENINTYGSASIEDTLAGLLDVFPQAFVNNVTGAVSGVVESNAAGAAQGFVENVAQPFFIPVISVIIFIIVFIICKIIATILEKTLGKAVNRLPIVGGLNKALGGVLGIAGGAINAVLVLFLFWFALAITGGNLPAFSNADLNGSFFYRLFLEYNPFF